MLIRGFLLLFYLHCYWIMTVPCYFSSVDWYPVLVVGFFRKIVACWTSLLCALIDSSEWRFFFFFEIDLYHFEPCICDSLKRKCFLVLYWNILFSFCCAGKLIELANSASLRQGWNEESFWSNCPWHVSFSFNFIYWICCLRSLHFISWFVLPLLFYQFIFTQISPVVQCLDYRRRC